MSTLNVSNITDGTTTLATEYVVNGSAKAWIQLNGTGTIAIQDSMNVSSISDLATGNGVVSFSNIMNNTGYSVSGSCNQADGSGGRSSVLGIYNYYVANYKFITTRSTSASVEDDPFVSTSVHGDLA